MSRAAGADRETLELAARRFRTALNAIDAEIWASVTIDAFPHGACGHASEMLGRFLRDTLGVEATYVVRDLRNPDGSWRSGHAWLEYNGLIIDITGDQFGWPAVVVTGTSSNHDTAESYLRQPLTSDLRWWATYCAPVYARAVAWLDAGGAGGGGRSSDG